MSIQVLPDSVVAQIAAGEVVERPASVVKELLENALDAGANHVHIAINGGGRKLIRISDNGSGIRSDELELAFTRHATSKLRVIDDLVSLATLGFRGEALSSIAAVSRITVTTRFRDERAGNQLHIEGGVIKSRQTVGAPVGTVISVENLFYNTPARLKFMKKENTEKRHIMALVTRYAMAYPHVRFVLEYDGREVFRSSGSGQLADVIVQAMGLDQFKQLIEVFAEDTAHDMDPTINVVGYTSTPELHRSDRSSITLFVNGRWIQDASLTYGVVQAYHNLLASGRYPVAVLMVDIQRDEVDVNVHPTKAEVRFRDPGAVFSTVQRAVRQAVIALSQPLGSRIAGVNMRWQPEQGESDQMDLHLDVDDVAADQRAPNRRQGYASGDPTEVPFGPEAPLKPRTLPLLRVVGQVGARYIVAEGPAGMYLVDQHAAHKRVLYEHFKDAIKQNHVQITAVSTPQTIDLSGAESRVIDKGLETLRMVGLELEPFGLNTFRILGVPDEISDLDPTELFPSVVDDLRNGTPDEVIDRLVQRMCRMAAVKTGEILNIEEMQSLIRQLERCESPRISPEGAATLVHMTGEQLARQFERNS